MYKRVYLHNHPPSANETLNTTTYNNTFSMPFLKSSRFAADKIYNGLTGKYKFEIFFPWFFLILLKFIRILPYSLYFYLIKKITKL